MTHPSQLSVDGQRTVSDWFGVTREEKDSGDHMG